MRSEFPYCFVSLYMNNIIWYECLDIHGNSYCSSDCRKTDFTERSKSQIHALERKMEDVVGKYTYLSVKYANLSSNYKDLSTKNNDQPQSTPTCPLDTLTWLPHTTTNFLNTTTCPPNTIRCRPKLTVCFYASHWR